MNSTEIKAALLYYFRYKRNFIAAPEIKTEYLGISDMLALDKSGKAWDIEIKISIQDLKNDFKKVKHRYYKDWNKDYLIIPNYFYFCIPIELLEHKYIKELKEMNYFGIITYNQKSIYLNKKIYIHRKAPLINKTLNENHYKNLIIKRLVAECYNSYIAK